MAGDLSTKAALFAVYHVIPYKGIETLLAAEIPITVQRRFWATAHTRDDYPSECGALEATADDAAVKAHTIAVLKKRKGTFDGYAPLLVAACRTQAELPPALTTFLRDINGKLTGTPLSRPTVDAAHPGGDARGA